MTLERVGFTVGEVLDQLVSLMQHRTDEKGLALTIELPPDLASLPLQGDPLRLGQVLINLTGNALKFTERGHIVVRVAMDDRDAHWVMLNFEVQDSGIGIAAEDQPRLFKAFEQADGSMTRKYGGTGLGLAISKRLVGLMGGDIGVRSEPGKGSTFFFSIRVERASHTAEPPAPTLPAESAEMRLQREFAGTHVLLTEDEPISQEVARALLEELGLVLDVADDGATALAFARRKPYALILMDMQMPVMNGVDATKAIRADSLNMSTPILAMTANAFEEDRQRCLEAGMDDHIPKPINPDQLFDTLLMWLEKSRS
jgi:CheY-like chemotaxis protein